VGPCFCFPLQRIQTLAIAIAKQTTLLVRGSIALGIDSEDDLPRSLRSGGDNDGDNGEMVVPHSPLRTDEVDSVVLLGKSDKMRPSTSRMTDSYQERLST
jgi:hypothetical protein